jgi:hypothetical protein
MTDLQTSPPPEIVAFALAPGIDHQTFGGSAHVGEGLSFNFRPALDEGEGLIVTDDVKLTRALAEFINTFTRVQVPTGALITSHQFARPGGEQHEAPHHPRLHELPGTYADEWRPEDIPGLTFEEMAQRAITQQDDTPKESDEEGQLRENTEAAEREAEQQAQLEQEQAERGRVAPDDDDLKGSK